MNVVFHSVDSNDNKVFFRATGRVYNNKITFKDESTPGTYVELTRGSTIKFRRYGSVSMEMEFMLQKRTRGFYENNLGLEFEFEVLTTGLEIENNKISIEYTMFLCGDRLSDHKIWILLH